MSSQPECLDCGVFVHHGKCLCEGCSDTIRAELAALDNLLAVIHRDGGHYQSEHGTEKACKDAEAVVQGLRTALESISRDTHCDGPGCPFCEADEPHPPSISAIAARAALVGAPTKGE